MIINGGIRFCEKGLTTSLRAMHVQSELIGMYNENVTGFDKIGYQRKDPVVSSFTEFIGVHGLSQTIDDKVGRIQMSDNPLDLALAEKGYFQTMNADGIRLTRDGRFKLDKDGFLLTLEDDNVLSNAGVPIQLPVVPEQIKDVRVNSKGLVSVLNRKTNKFENAGYIGKQGYNEYSNVALQDEFIQMMPIIRNFEANRQIFMIQNQNLQKVISQLGQA